MVPRGAYWSTRRLVLCASVRPLLPGGRTHQPEAERDGLGQAGLLMGWLVAWMAGWVAAWVAGCVARRQAGRLDSRLARRLASWLATWPGE